MFSFPSFTVSLGDLKSQQCSAGDRSRKAAFPSTFAAPRLYMTFLRIRCLTLPKACCASSVFPHRAGIPQGSLCSPTPRPSAWFSHQLEKLDCARQPCSWLLGSLTGGEGTQRSVHSSCGENSSFLLSSQGFCLSLPVSLWHCRQELILISCKPWPASKLHSDTCEIE